MQWCRFQIEQRVRYGVVEDDRVTEIIGSPLAEHTVTDTHHAFADIGVRHFMFNFQRDTLEETLARMERFATTVRPRVES